MFEKEIKFITDFNLEKLKPLGSYFTFDEILTTDIHPSITKYISAELSYLIFEDREKLLSSSIFDYSQPQVIKLLKSVDNELKKFKAISFEDIKQLVLQAVSFNANFIVRPKWSLLKLVYNEAETKSSEEIILMLDYIYFHEYLRNIITEYIEKKKLLEIKKDKFEEIISKIDSALIQNDAQNFIDNSLLTMLDFYSIGSKSEIKINTDYVEIFLKEKDLLDPLLKLKKRFTFGTGTSANLEEIEKILFSDEIITDSIQAELEEKEVKVSDEELIINNKVEEKNEKIDEQINTDENIINQQKNEEIQHEHKNKVSEHEKDDKILSSEKEIIDESEIKNEEINENDLTENIEEESYETEEHNNKTDKYELSVNDELLSAENDDELLTLFDEELKALAEDTGIENDIDFSVESSENNLEVEEDLLSEKEEKEEKENDMGQPEKISEEVNTADNSSEEKVDESQSIYFEKDENEPSNFVEEIPDEPLAATDDEAIEEELSEETKNEKPGEHQPEPQTKSHREKDIFHYLSDKEIDKIVSNVFNEDQEDFATTLEKVSECETLEEANEIIKSVFISYRVNMYTKDASTLTGAISNYFNQ